MAQALQSGDTVAVFPEGTTGEGQALLPFHANLLQAAITTATPVQPVALRYADAQHAVSPAALWVGDTTLVQSLWRWRAGRAWWCMLHVLPPMATAHADRRALAEHLRDVIGQALRVESERMMRQHLPQAPGRSS
jgi:1-acyl-sn-glycerol-3-phosphate acyltransferase